MSRQGQHGAGKCSENITQVGVQLYMCTCVCCTSNITQVGVQLYMCTLYTKYYTGWCTTVQCTCVRFTPNIAQVGVQLYMCTFYNYMCTTVHVYVVHQNEVVWENEVWCDYTCSLSFILGCEFRYECPPKLRFKISTNNLSSDILRLPSNGADFFQILLVSNLVFCTGEYQSDYSKRERLIIVILICPHPEFLLC